MKWTVWTSELRFCLEIIRLFITKKSYKDDKNYEPEKQRLARTLSYSFMMLIVKDCILSA